MTYKKKGEIYDDDQMNPPNKVGVDVTFFKPFLII